MADLRITLDNDTKESAEALFNNMGTSLSNAVKMFISQSLNSGGFPFQPTGEHKILNQDTLNALQELDEGKGIKSKNSTELFKKLDI